MPFSIIQEILNALIVGVNVIFSILTGIVNALIQLVLGVIYGIINFVVGGLYTILATYLPLDAWVNLSVVSSMWTFQLQQVDFSPYFDIGLSPIGMFLNTIIQDELISNVIGGIAFGALAILVIIVAMKTRK